MAEGQPSDDVKEGDWWIGPGGDRWQVVRLGPLSAEVQDENGERARLPNMCFAFGVIEPTL